VIKEDQATKFHQFSKWFS